MARMDFMECLPADCPPPKAERLISEKVVYRIVNECPPTIDDFRSQRQERPRARFNLPECLVCGVSVFADQSRAMETAKLPKFRSKGMRVAKVKLMPDSGYILKTGSVSHYTFWPFASFKPLAVAEEVSS